MENYCSNSKVIKVCHQLSQAKQGDKKKYYCQSHPCQTRKLSGTCTASTGLTNTHMERSVNPNETPL